MEIALPLQRLIADAWTEYASHGATEYVVRPSIPILYFGDLEAYQGAKLRVITAALNPSRTEFPDGDRFRRFRRAENVFPEILDGRLFDRYLGGLGTYYRDEPYRRWFSALEPVLNGMGASFYPDGGDAALHTDICTPLATDPTWSNLSDAARSRLIGPGLRIWHDLVDYLRPDVILLSVAARHLATIRFPSLEPPTPLFTVQRDRPYIVTETRLTLTNGKMTRLIFGRAANTPFGLISNDDKRALGRVIRGEVKGG